MLLGLFDTKIARRYSFADESKTVDLYNNVTNAWGTATLNVARKYLAAASVCNVALFAGGVHDGVLISFGSFTARA